MDRKWWKATEAEAIGLELIGSGFTEFESHSWLDIRYIFTNTETGKDGCKVAASTRKLPGLYAALTQDGGLADEPSDMTASPRVIFVVQIWADAWERLDAKQKRALIHHELMHIDAIDVRMRSHSIEEHNQTVRRFGEWQGGLRLFREAMDEATA